MRQIELKKLFRAASPRATALREPNDIASYAALACIAIQSNQNDQHGGQAICDFDYGLAEGVRKTYRRLYKKHLAEAVDLLLGDSVDDSRAFAQDARAHRGGDGRGPASPWTRASRPPCARRSWRSAPARRPPTRPWPMRLRTPWAIPTARRSRPWRRSCTT
ncbi:MAG: anaerobic ribonucleoside-triphosphate reductase [Adlercreutzia sp.]